MNPILSTSDLTKEFSIGTGAFSARRTFAAVDAVNLRLLPGETLGLAGESGCGKSTLAKLLMGLMPPSRGSVYFDGMEARTGSQRDRDRYRHIQMIFQDPYSSLNPRMRVGEIIGEPLVIHQNIQKGELRDAVLHLMEKVGLSGDHYGRFPHEFSGGQRQRIGIARAIAAGPKMILADEPVSALDLSIQAQIINLLQNLKEEFGLSFLFIAHDLSVVRHMSDRVAIMYLGKIIEQGSRQQIFSAFLHPYTEALLSAVPSVIPAKRTGKIILKGDMPSPLRIPSGCPFHTRCPYAKFPTCAEIVPVLEEKCPGHEAACHFSHELYL